MGERKKDWNRKKKEMENDRWIGREKEEKKNRQKRKRQYKRLR